ncbi:MAG: hypothetical protein RMI79_02915 [Nitrososphaerota archaeon]|nr:hypothetical protein [Nitrososphaerota archaeon]
MHRLGKNRTLLFLMLAVVLSISLETRVYISYVTDLYVDLKVSMNNDAIAFYTANMTFGPKAIKALREANWILRIQLPKWASIKLVYSTDMPVLLLADGGKIRLRLENEEAYDYLVAEIPSVDAESLNATLRIGFVQRDVIVGNSIGFKLPVLTGFNILPEYVNFTFRAGGRIESYTQYLIYFTPIFENNTVVGLWNLYLRPTTVGNITGSIYFSKPFDRCVIESLNREIEITEQLQVTVRDRLRVRYIGGGGTVEILRVMLPADIGQRIRAKDSLGPIQTYTYTLPESNASTISIYSRYSLNSGQEYEAIVEYDIPVKNIITSISGNTVSIKLKELANYSDIVNVYSLNVKVDSGKDWKIITDSTILGFKKGEVFTRSINNAMPNILVQPLSITFTHLQIEAGKSISIVLGLLTLAILLVVDIFKREVVVSVEELKEKKELRELIEKITGAISEKIDYECRLEETKVKNTLGKISSKEYKTSIEEYERRILGAEKKILKTIEQISLKNQKVGEEVKRNYDIFEEINSDAKKMIDNTIDRFRSGRITRSVFENLIWKYLRDNRKRRDSAADDIYKSLEKLGL